VSDTKNAIILITEDNPGHVLLFKKNLERLQIDARIHFVDNGKSAVDFLMRRGEHSAIFFGETPVYLILDLSLPQMDGFEVLKEVRSHPQTCKIPVIIFTTSNTQKEVDRCYELGCNLFFRKPVDYENFSKLIQQIILLASQAECPTRMPNQDKKNES